MARGYKRGRYQRLGIETNETWGELTVLNMGPQGRDELGHFPGCYTYGCALTDCRYPPGSVKP